MGAELSSRVNIVQLRRPTKRTQGGGAGGPQTSVPRITENGKYPTVIRMIVKHREGTSWCEYSLDILKRLQSICVLPINLPG